ncbi:MAG TPA: ABC transporter substrate-binding protein [Thermodesulfobacteriota bacterium]|nr:ABC transporter substrate-binding protein [Thermodesulfobacteriota bacterium]
MKKWSRLGMMLVAVLSLLWLGVSPVLAAPTGKPIVIGYVGNVASPGTKPCMDIQKYAVEEINKAGGILGRPVEYVVLDGKGDTSLSVEAAGDSSWRTKSPLSPSKGVRKFVSPLRKTLPLCLRNIPIF